MTDLHTWIVFVHVAGVLGFLIAHGVSAAVVFRLQGERDPAAVRTLLDLSRRSINVMSVALLVWLVAGIVAGFTANGGAGWWTSGRWWIWVSLLIGIVIIGVMTPFGRLYLNKVRMAVGIDPKTGAVNPAATVDPAALDAAIKSGQPALLAALALVGFAIILWLMIFKPF